jgi:hypothetical protein
VNIGVTSSIVLGDAEEKADDVLAGALLRLLLAAELVVRVVVPVILQSMLMLVRDRLSVVQRADRVDVNVLVGMGLDRRGGILGWLAAVAVDNIGE